VTIMHQPSCTKYGPGNDSEKPDVQRQVPTVSNKGQAGQQQQAPDTNKNLDMPFNRLGRIRRSLKGKEALSHFKTMSNVSNACRITEQLEDGTSIIDYIDLKRVQFDQDFQRTSFIQSQETERLQKIKYIEEKRTRELNNIKKTFKVAYRLEDVVQKRWVKKTRMVKKMHTCIHEELVEKSMLVGTVKIQRDFQEQQKTSYEWQPVPKREKLYDQLVQVIKKYPVQPRQEILTYPDLETKDYQVRELVVYDTDIHAQIVFQDAVEPVYNNYISYVKYAVPRVEKVAILKEVHTEKMMHWDEIKKEVRVTEVEVEEEYWVEEEFKEPKLLPYIIEGPSENIQFSEPYVKTTVEVETNEVTVFKEEKTDHTVSLTKYEQENKTTEKNLRDCRVVNRRFIN